MPEHGMRTGAQAFRKRIEGGALWTLISHWLPSRTSAWVGGAWLIAMRASACRNCCIGALRALAGRCGRPATLAPPTVWRLT